MNLANLSDADLRALRDGNLAGLSDDGLAMLRGADAPPAPRPPVDPESIGLDPRDAQARRRPAPAETLPGALREVWEQSTLRSGLQGAKDLYQGGKQLAVRGANLAGMVPDSTVESVDRDIRQENDQYLYSQGRKAGDFDPFRTAGNILTGAAALPLRLFSAPAAVRTGAAFVPLGRRAAGVAARGADAAAVGALAGAVQPVHEGDFASEKGTQVGVGAAAGAIGGPAIEGLVRAVGPVVNTVRNLVRRAGGTLQPRQVDNLIAQALEQQDIPWASLSDDVREAMRQDVRQALATGDLVDPVHLRRLADIRAVGATPTRGAVTLDPVQVSIERNTAKQGGNSTDPIQQQLARAYDGNNTAYINRMNTLAGDSGADEMAAGALSMRALRNRDAQRTATTTRLYREAEDLHGGAIPLDARLPLQNVIRELELTGKLPYLGDERTVVNQIIDGTLPLDVGRAEGIKSTLAEQILAARSGPTPNGSRATALSRVYEVLENAEPAVPLGREAQAAFRRARDSHRAKMGVRERTPALQAVIDGVEPDQFMQRFILGKTDRASVESVQRMRRAMEGDQEALDAVRTAIVDHLKLKAVSKETEDDLAGFSGKRLRDAINAIGDRKLAVFFSPQEIAQLRQVGRAASYGQVQKPGTSVNNSNTAAAAIGAFDRILARVPYLGEVGRGHINRVVQNQERAGIAANALRAVPATGGQAMNAGVQNALVRSLPAPTSRALAGVLATQQEE